MSSNDSDSEYDYFPFEAFLWRGRALDNPATEWEPDMSDEEVTAYLIEQIRTCSFDDTTAVLHQLATIGSNAKYWNVQRLWKSKVIFSGKQKTIVKPTCDTAAKATAIVIYLFTDAQRAEKCSRCKNSRSHGPLDMCFVPTEPYTTKGACVNCWYQGRSGDCMHRKTKEERDKQEMRREMAEWKGLTDKDIEGLTTGEIRRMLKICDDELQKRKQKR